MVWCYCTFFCCLLEIFGRCYANWQWTVIDLFCWLMFMPLVADGMPLMCDVVDVITTSILGWCYMPLVADGIATSVWCGRCYYHLADVMANRMEWIGRCYSQCGRWNNHWVFTFILILVLWCYSEPHPIYEADGTCLCFCSGMDCWP